MEVGEEGDYIHIAIIIDLQLSVEISSPRVNTVLQSWWSDRKLVEKGVWAYSLVWKSLVHESTQYYNHGGQIESL